MKYIVFVAPVAIFNVDAATFRVKHDGSSLKSADDDYPCAAQTSGDGVYAQCGYNFVQTNSCCVTKDQYGNDLVCKASGTDNGWMGCLTSDGDTTTSTTTTSTTSDGKTTTSTTTTSGDNPSTGGYAVSFDSDNNVTLSDNGATVTIDGDNLGGRAVSQHKYKNISQITATINLGGMNKTGDEILKHVNAAFYMVTDGGSQPIGSNYCDAGGNNKGMQCREIDFMETNGTSVLQSTMHLGLNSCDDGLQSYEYSYTSAAENCTEGCWTGMSADDDEGLHDMSAFDMDQAFDMTVTFDTDSMTSTNGQTGMTVVVSQNGNSATIYNGNGAEGSKSLDGTDLVSTMNSGYWLIVSYWQGYSPDQWYEYGPDGSFCSPYSNMDSSSSWTITNVQVVGEQV